MILPGCCTYKCQHVCACVSETYFSSNHVITCPHVFFIYLCHPCSIYLCEHMCACTAAIYGTMRAIYGTMRA